MKLVYEISICSEEGMVGTMCDLSLGIAKEYFYKGYERGRREEMRRFFKLISIFLEEGDIEMIQKVTDDPALHELLYKKYHIT